MATVRRDHELLFECLLQAVSGYAYVYLARQTEIERRLEVEQAAKGQLGFP